MESILLTETFDSASLALDELLSTMPAFDIDLSISDPYADNTNATATSLSPPRQVLSSSDPPHAPPPPMPKKKRVRREVRELRHLRDQTRKLELRLEQLKKRVPADYQQGVPRGVMSSAPSLWSNIAERQLWERMRTEEVQRTLRAACSEQAKFAAELKKLLKACTPTKNITALTELKPAALSDEDCAGIYAEQLTLIAKVFAQLQQSQLVRPKLLLSDMTTGVEVVKKSPIGNTGIVFEMHCTTTVPFDVRVAGNAYWRMSVCEAYQRQGSRVQEMDTGSTLLSTSFALNVRCDDFTANVHGHQTCRRYSSDDTEVIVWVGYANPVEFNGARFYGVQCKKTGWIKLQRGSDQSSTTVEMYSEMTPVFAEGSTDQQAQICTLVDAMGNAHKKTNDIYCSIMRELLLEEDWKATVEGEVLGL
ncbi:hypothetical protein PHYBOEH_003205 [Phytophthora boehmeriae]|uniref:M96 mating-specific protein family n=1 Tax=Phytophthora boehmeriae TaxID=109152 RepID=A0A8T1WVV8_9STRA|nr:hypothetical protein PHYBOEH_003205 [Phytophthora boehmeriae]